MGARIGAEFTRRIRTVTRPVALRGGKPLSVTMTPSLLVVAPLPLGVVQLSWPVAGSKVTPRGAPGRRRKVRVCGGRSASFTDVTSWRASPSLIVTRLGANEMVGAVL